MFWVRASNAARFEQSFRNIADQVKIYGRRDPQANIFKLVHDWLCNCKQRWLLVLDGVDDARFLLDVQADTKGGQATNATGDGRLLHKYLPYCEQGSIIITTRSNETALKLVKHRNVLSVEPMNEAEALELFKKKLGRREDSSDVAKLAAALEYMPLAIVQAAAYISQRTRPYSVKRYLDKFEKSERKRTGREAKNPVIVTWMISFEYIQQKRRPAADLLSIMSFFDRQGISESLLQRRATPEHDQAAQKEREGVDADSDSEDSASRPGVDDNEFEEDVTVLQNFYFISVDIAGTSYEMHELVQLAMKKWLEKNKMLERWKQQFIRNLHAAILAMKKWLEHNSNLHAAILMGEDVSWTTCQALYAHAKAAVEQQPEDESALVEWAKVLCCAAWFAKEIGNISDAEMLATKAVEAQKKVLGQEHEDTLWSVAMIGSVYKLQGHLDEAKTLHVQVMEGFKKNFGADHPVTLTSMADLALTWKEQGRTADAIALMRKCLRRRRRVLEASHPDIEFSLTVLEQWKAEQVHASLPYKLRQLLPNWRAWKA